MMTNKIKTVKKSVRFGEDLHFRLQQRAQQAGVPFSKYVIMRLLEDEEMNSEEVQSLSNPKSQFSCEHDRELMKLILKSFILTREMAKKALDEAKILECAEIATTKLKEWKYE